MIPSTLVIVSLVAAQIPSSAAPLAGQAMTLAANGPRFMVSASRGSADPVEVDASRIATLRRRVSLSFEDVPLADALETITRQTGIRFAYVQSVLPVDKPVRFQSSGITLAAALTELLLGLRVDVLVRSADQLAIIRRVQQPPVEQEGVISGRVTAARSAKGVSEARVFVEGTTLHTTTDAGGKFRIDAVPAGLRTVVVTAIGFERRRITTQVVAGETRALSIELNAVVVTLEDVVVTGTAFETKRKTVPSPINLISTQDIERKQSVRLEDLLRGEIPGLTILSGGQYDWDARLYVRGNSGWGAGYGDVVKIYIDGIEVASPVYISTFAPEDIERIEVVRGPQASTIYGSEASSGVVQIFTKRGRSGQGNRPQIALKASAGVMQSDYRPIGTGAPVAQDHSVELSGGSSPESSSDYSYRVGVSYRSLGEWMKNFHSNTLAFQAGLRTVQGPLTAEFSAQWSNRNISRPQDITFLSLPPSVDCPQCGDPNAYEKGQYTFTDNVMGVNLSLRATSRWQHNLILGDDKNRLAFYQPAGNLFTPGDTLVQLIQREYGRRSIRYNTAYQADLAKSVTGRFTAGADYWSYYVQGATGSNLVNAIGVVRNSSQTSSSFLNDTWWNAGFFGMAEIGFRDRLFLTLATRVEQNPNFGKNYSRAVSPRVGAAYVQNVGSVQVKTRLAWGRGIRPPQAVQRAGQVGTSVTFLPNPEIGPEEKAGWDAGLELYWGRRGSLVITRYQEEGKDLIQPVDIDVTSRPRTRQYQNIGRVSSKGWEIEGAVNFGPVSVRANLATLDNKIKALSNQYLSNPTGLYHVGDRIASLPKYSGGGGLTVRFGRGSADLNMSMMGDWEDYDVVAYYRFAYGFEDYRGSERAYIVDYPALTKWNLGVQQDLSSRVTAFVRVDNLGKNQRNDYGNGYVAQGRTTSVGVRVIY